MDPISAAFASYIDLVSFRATKRMTDMLGTEVQTVVVEHQGIRIPYMYQIWKIKPKSVCSSYSQNISNYSKCTIAAQSLFKDTCAYLQANPKEHWKHLKLKNMYCAAAITYKPTMASIESAAVQSPLDKARAKCNLAVAEAMGNQSNENKKKKEKACAEYRTLNTQQPK